MSGKQIVPNKTAIIFDEIQAYPQAIASLKYFCENAPEYHIISAGSLLGVAVNRERISFPVGKIDSLTMYPMNFKEFLWATENDALLAMIEECFENDSPLMDILHEKAMGLYRTYLLVGGMPECVSEYVKMNDFDFVKVKQNRIFSDYKSDIQLLLGCNDLVTSKYFSKSTGKMSVESDGYMTNRKTFAVAQVKM